MSKKKRKPSTRNSPAWMVAGCVGKNGKEDYLAWRNRGFLSPNGASPVRRIDPVSGEVVVTDGLEELASAILKADRSRGSKPKRSKKRKQIKARTPRQANKAPAADRKAEFYKSWEWRTLRMEVLKEQGRICQCCGAAPSDKNQNGGRVRIQVDHIKPLSRYWHLRLDKSNLQVLCGECNQGKGNWDETDYRCDEPPFAEADELTREYRNVIGFPPAHSKKPRTKEVAA